MVAGEGRMTNGVAMVPLRPDRRAVRLYGQVERQGPRGCTSPTVTVQTTVTIGRMSISAQPHCRTRTA